MYASTWIMTKIGGRQMQVRGSVGEVEPGRVVRTRRTSGGSSSGSVSLVGSPLRNAVSVDADGVEELMRRRRASSGSVRSERTVEELRI